jgi:hypothetical protein
MTKHHRRTLGRVLSALLLAGSTLPFVSGVAGAVLSHTTNPFYLVIGASDSLGVQLSPSGHGTRRTSQGYANDVVAAEAARGVSLAMTQIGCPGESTFTMINGGDRCYSGTNTQLATAIAFLSSHRSDTGLVTIDLGFNNLIPCFANGSPDPTCIANLLPKLRLDMVTILTALKAAAGPHVTFVGLDHFNPYLASAVAGASGRTIANQSVAKFTTLNRTLYDVYGSFGVTIAHVAAAFHLADSDPVHSHGTRVPSDALHVCSLTYMCSSRHAPNFHPDSRGYQIIANAIVATLPPTWPT